MFVLFPSTITYTPSLPFLMSFISFFKAFCNFTGWVCVLALGVDYLVSPMAAGFGIDIPQADGGTLMPILGGLLGLGSMRSAERIKGVGK